HPTAVDFGDFDRAPHKIGCGRKFKTLYSLPVPEFNWPFGIVGIVGVEHNVVAVRSGAEQEDRMVDFQAWELNHMDNTRHAVLNLVKRALKSRGLAPGWERP